MSSAWPKRWAGACRWGCDRSQAVVSWEKGSHTSTFGGNPVACEAGLATIEVIEKEGLMRNAAEQGAHIQKRLRRLQQRCRSMATCAAVV